MLYFDIFDREYIQNSPTSGIIIPRDTDYLRKMYSNNRDMIENYYLSRNFAVRNTHILSRFLEHIAPHFSYDNLRYVEYIENRIEYLGKHFKFTSDIEKGMVHPPHFFANEGEEIILVDHSLFDVERVVRNWEREPCISILSHPRNDTKLLLPLGNDDESRGGLAVVAINLVKLALKYREFMKVQYRNSLKELPVLNKNFFIIKYVLAPMMGDHIDHMFLNKIMDRFYGREEVTPRFRHRFKVFEPTKQINRFVDNTLEVITDKKIDFVNILKNINLVFNTNAGDLLALPEYSGTRQSRWGLVISRLEYMCFLYDVAVEKDRSRHHINDWQRLVTRVRRDKGILGEFSYVEGKKIEELMDRVMDM